MASHELAPFRVGKPDLNNSLAGVSLTPAPQECPPYTSPWGPALRFLLVRPFVLATVHVIHEVTLT